MRSLSRRLFAAGALGLIASPAIAHDFTAGGVTIDHPIVTPTIGVVRVNAGYMTIINRGQTADRLLAAESPSARAIEIHTHERVDGVMRMRQVSGGVPVPAGGRVAFAPGGLHLMIYDPVKPVTDGDFFEIFLTFERAGRVRIVAIAERPSPNGHSH
jgi:hypothetical protein